MPSCLRGGSIAFIFGNPASSIEPTNDTPCLSIMFPIVWLGLRIILVCPLSVFKGAIVTIVEQLRDGVYVYTPKAHLIAPALIILQLFEVLVLNCQSTHRKARQ